MICVDLQGGLGNQLFQIASCYGISRKHNKRLYAKFNENKHNINNLNYCDSILRNVNNIMNINEQISLESIYREDGKHVLLYVDIPNNYNNALFVGYFQNDKYFKDYKNEIYDLFRIPDDIKNYLINKYSNLENKYFIHFRRGDYLEVEMHNINLINYYNNCLNLLDKNIELLVFSNDIEYCKTVDFLKDYNLTFVDENEINSLYLMSLCRLGGICANSSYSWWGSYLNENPDKKVFMPNKWFNNDYLNDIYYENVRIIDINNELNNINAIKHILYINLDKRIDRKEHVIKEFNELGLKIERFPAIKLDNGALGCSLSHLRCLEIAKENNWEYIMIVEDDILFLNKELFKNQINNFLLKHKDFDVLLLTGNNVDSHIYIDENCVQVKNCQTTTGYLVKSNYYDKLINNYKESIKLLSENNIIEQYSIDIYWKRLQNEDKWYLLTPLTILQIPNYSDITKCNVNYNEMLYLDKENTITFSSCFYIIKSKFDKSIYIEWMNNLISIVYNFNLVIYTDLDSVEYINKQNNPKIKIIIKSIDNFYNYKYKDFWIKNHENNNLLNDRTCWELNMLWSEKIHFIKETINNKYFYSKYYGWCDIGYFRNKDKLYNWCNNLSFLNNKIYYGCINNDNNYMNELYNLINNKNELGLPINPIPPNQLSVAGGFFILQENNIDWWFNTFDNKLKLYFDNNYLVKDDQIILIDCIFSNFDKFELLKENNEEYDNWFMFQRYLNKSTFTNINKYERNENCLISILMPIYNGIEFINDSISSIINQTFDKWELLIGINGHTENSNIYKIAKKYENNKIKVFDFHNIKGKSNTLNELIKYAETNYIALLDVDDIWFNDKLKYQIPFLNDYDVIGTNCVYFGNINNIIPAIPQFDCSNFNFSICNPIINSSVIIRKELCYWNKIYDGLEDYDLWIRLRKQNKKFYNSPQILVKHRIHTNSSFNNTNNNNVNNLLNIHGLTKIEGLTTDQIRYNHLLNI